MAKIVVDWNQLERTAGTIDDYIKSHKQKMNNIDKSITNLSLSWQGSDYNQVKKEWLEMYGAGSTSDQMLKALTSYSDYLRFSANKYKSAQASAINRANRLPKY